MELEITGAREEGADRLSVDPVVCMFVGRLSVEVEDWLRARFSINKID